MTPFEALCTALAGTVGTGNIAGVAVALSMGGAGAVFWMWVSAFLGMGVKYSEIVLAVKYRERRDGYYVGGPMYTIKNGMGRRYYPLAVVFCVSGAAASFGIGNLTQIGAMSTAIKAAFPAGDAMVALTGVLMAVLCGVTVSGGTAGRGRTAAKLVPLMSAIYVSGALVVIIANASNVPRAIGAIFSGAFSRKAISGGAAGSALSWGLRRGLFSSEAGLGSSPIAHASADTDSPVEQGFWGIFEVFVDTIIICTLTALMVLVSGTVRTGEGIAGAEAVAAALGTVFNGEIASIFLAVSMGLFAFSSVVGWSLYGERCVEFLTGRRGVLIYRVIFTALVAVGTAVEFETAVGLSDAMNALMMFPNLIATARLTGTVRQETAAWLTKRGNRSA